MSSAAITDFAPNHYGDAGLKKLATIGLFVSMAPFVLALAGYNTLFGEGWLRLGVTFVPFLAFAFMRIVATYKGTTPGIKNDGVFIQEVSGRKIGGFVLGAVLTALYVMLYWTTALLPVAETLEPLSQLIRGKGADKWFLYGFLYTLAVLVMGTRMLYRYRNNKYQIFRTLSVMFFQLAFGFMIPGILVAFNQPEFYFTYFWPLKPEYLFPSKFHELVNHPGGLGLWMATWGVLMSFILTPFLTWRFGKRWYCSWMCGCGGLAETAGDPFRQLSSKKLKAWKFERWSIHLVLVLIVVLTALLWVAPKTEFAKHYKSWYAFIVGAALSGVVGVGFYPLLGSRVWCRFFCPMAAVLGVFQRFFSRFRITTNGAQCMSCGNCSTYCEMGIDVRSYAMQGKNIVRASCVGCGICAAVCPRGVLKLENGKTIKDRFDGAEHPMTDLIKSLKTW
ncbi:MAG: ferredoxin-type protein NapH [Bradymonadia bacterium]|jgi:ferredoxin-type protein NapH